MPGLLFVLGDLWNTVVCFQPRSLLIGKVWVPVMYFRVCLIHCRVHWRVGRLISVLPLIGSTIWAFSMLYWLCSVGIGGSILSILIQFLSNRSQHIMLDGCLSKLVNLSGVPQDSVLGPLLILYTGDFFNFGK